MLHLHDVVGDALPLPNEDRPLPCPRLVGQRRGLRSREIAI